MLKANMDIKDSACILKVDNLMLIVYQYKSDGDQTSDRKYISFSLTFSPP